MLFIKNILIEKRNQVFRLVVNLHFLFYKHIQLRVLALRGQVFMWSLTEKKVREPPSIFIWYLAKWAGEGDNSSIQGHYPITILLWFIFSYFYIYINGYILFIFIFYIYIYGYFLIFSYFFFLLVRLENLREET